MDTKTVRTIAIVGNNASGKTTLAEAMLYFTKAVPKQGKVDDGTSVMDFEPEEIRRKISISNAFHHFMWNKHHIYLMDTPGDDNFLSETRIALHGADAVIFVVDATDPTKPQAQKIAAVVKELGLPGIVFVNKMDKENAEFKKTLDFFRAETCCNLVPIALPIHEKGTLKAIIDLVQQKAYGHPVDTVGPPRAMAIPQQAQDEAEAMKNNLTEFSAESDDDLLEKFLEGGELTDEEIMKGLRQGTLKGGFLPVMCGSASSLTGVSMLLDAVLSMFPSPDERPGLDGEDVKTKKTVSRAPLSSEPFSAIVLKTMVDPYAGKLSVLKVISGELNSEMSVLNANNDTMEKIGQLLLIEGKAQSVRTIPAGPGEIVAVAKLKDTRTGDTLCDGSRPVQFSFIDLPSPVLTYAVVPKSRGDEEKITQALAKLQEEDPSLWVSRNAETAELLLSGNGQIHIDTSVEKMERKFGVHVDLKLPKIPYRETIKGVQKGVVYRHKKQTGGAGQFAEVHFDISAMPRGGGFEFEEALVGMNVPRNFVPAVEKGIHEAMQVGPIAGFPVVDVKVRFYDGKSHEVDSSEMAFKLAAIQCFKKGMMDAKPIMLEPLVKLTITVPDDYIGDIIGDLNSRRGRVMGMEPGESGQKVLAITPMSEVQRYVLDLNAMTGGRGTFVMEPSHYEEVPGQIADKLIAALNEAKAASEK